MKRGFFLWLLILMACAATAKVPDLTPRDVKVKLDEIFKAHVGYRRFTPELIERTLQNFLDELDPSKGYFLEGEISLWRTPSEPLLQALIDPLNKGDYSIFHQIYTLLEPAIERRSLLEMQIAKEPLPKNVNREEFKDLEFATTPDELLSRLLRIKSLQIETASRFGDGDHRDLFLQSIQKKRVNRESDLLNPSVEERHKLLLSYILKAATAALDSHTNYFTPSEATQFLIQVQQRLFGIGAQLRDNLDGFTVVRILENSPASQSKLKMNDRIIAVDGIPVIGFDIVEAVDLIRGEKDSSVSLTVLRESKNSDEPNRVEKLEIELTRNEVVLDETRLETHQEPFGDGQIAYLKLFSFYQDQKNSSASDMRKALETLKKEGKLRGVLLDLRNNAGGLLPQAVAVTGLFINKGIVVSIKDNSGKLQHLREVEGKPIWDGPLVVLVNRASASAAEIVAQTLQDYGRAIVIGDDHTFGKGTFQTFTLDPIANSKINPQGEYKVTRGRYYTVSGKSPQLVGVQSDIVVPGILSYLDIGEKFAKFPLINDEIEPHFEDDLSDLSPLHRLQLGPMYRYNLQTKLHTYLSFLDPLKSNSQLRIGNNKNYQHFLTEIQKKNFDDESIDLITHSDFQLMESFNIMKDLIFLMQMQDTRLAS